MASGAQVLAAAENLAAARLGVDQAQASFNVQEAIVQSLIVPERTALDAAQLVYAEAQDAARAETSGWQPALAALLAAQQAEAEAVQALIELPFDGS